MPKAIEIDVLSMEDAPTPKKDTGVDLAPYMDTLRRSWEKLQAGSPNPGFKFTVPTAQVATLKKRLQDAAKALGLGTRFQTSADVDGRTAVVVAASQRKQMPARKPAAEGSAAPAPASGKMPAPAAGRKGTK